MLGPELVINGGFTGSADGWDFYNGVFYNDNNIKFTGGKANAECIPHGYAPYCFPLKVGKSYQVSVDVIGGTPGLTVDFWIDSLLGGADYDLLLQQTLNSGSGVFTTTVTPTKNQLYEAFVATDFTDIHAYFDGIIDNISVREIVGVLPTYNPSVITNVNRIQQNLASPQFIMAGVGGAGEDEYKLFKKSNSYGFNIWRSKVYQIGETFDIQSIILNLNTDLTANTEITPIVYFDDEDSVVAGTTINNTNFTDKHIVLTSKNFNNGLHGDSNFFLEFQFTGSDLSSISLPITINIETSET